VLKTWAAALPEGALAIPDLTDNQKKLLKVLRTAVPPQLPLLADHLVQVVEDDPTTHDELADGGNRLTSFPETARLWRDFRTKISRHVDGIKASVRSAIREVAQVGPEETSVDYARVVRAIKPLERLAPSNAPIKQIVERLSVPQEAGDIVEKVAAAIANKAPASLTDEDYGRAAGMLEIAAAIGVQDNKTTILLPVGGKRSLQEVVHPEAKSRIDSDVRVWRDTFNLSPDQIAALAIDAIYSAIEEQGGAVIITEPVHPQASETTGSVNVQENG
jgi:hypothetical protein